MARTGREDTIVYYCPHCGDRDPPMVRNTLRTALCERCRHRLNFVIYEAGVEDEAAEEVIAASRIEVRNGLREAWSDPDGAA
jgi:hypothetical protein